MADEFTPLQHETARQINRAIMAAFKHLDKADQIFGPVSVVQLLLQHQLAAIDAINNPGISQTMRDMFRETLGDL